MNSAPFRPTTSEPPKLRAFGSGNGPSFAERAAAFRPATEPIQKPVEPVMIPVSTATTMATVVPTVPAVAPTVAPSFSSAPKLSAAATAAYVPKNARSTTNTVVLTPDMFPALPSKTTATTAAAAATIATAVDTSAPKKMTFADLMKKRVAQDAIEAEQAERDRLREQARKDREERDLRSIQMVPRRTHYGAEQVTEEEEVLKGYDGMYEENAFDRPTGGYNSSRYGHHEDEMSPPVDDMGVPDDEEWNE